MVFDGCDVNAIGGLSKRVAIAFNECPDELTFWLVEQGADIRAGDDKGYTPLHSRAGWRHGNLQILIDLGASVDDKSINLETPLHVAANSRSWHNVKLLLANGANVNALNKEGLIPLELAMRYCRPNSIEDTANIAKSLLVAGSHVTSRMKAYIEEIGTKFENIRQHFNPECVNATADALNELYKLIDVKPIPKRKMHNINLLIEVESKDWETQYLELWDKLVPGIGAAETIQGEVIRIAGRITDELRLNGAINWDKDFKKMADTFVKIIQKGQSLPDAELNEAKTIITAIKKKIDDIRLLERMIELSVKWVMLNLQPIKNDNDSYNR